MWANIRVVNEDARKVACDVLVLKYADGHHGLDAIVASDLGKMDFALKKGTHAFYASRGKPAAGEVLALGVGPLHSFEYDEIEKFGRRAVDTIKTERPATKRVCFTLHGSGYGLDELASFDSMLKGIRSSEHGRNLEVVVAERNKRLASQLENYLVGLSVSLQRSTLETPQSSPSQLTEILSRADAHDHRLFTAMPFKDAFLDHWELAIQAAVHATGYICERLDYEAFTGDIVHEIRNRIGKARGVVALLDEFNANVFLEVGYAWGINRPTILLLEQSVEAPFDVRGQRIIRYSRLGDLKANLEREILALKQSRAI